MDNWQTITLDNINDLPSSWGCYAFVVAGVVVYIGRSKMLWNRIRRHPMIKRLRDEVEVQLKYSLDTDDYDREKELVREYKPIYNVEYICKHPG